VESVLFTRDGPGGLDSARAQHVVVLEQKQDQEVAIEEIFVENLVQLLLAHRYRR